MISDPNWLYSTIAQSSAAIVAIIGGFITHSVLTLTAERRSLAHQKADKKTRLEALKSERAKLIDLHETMRVEMFFKTVASELAKEDKLPSLEELLQRHPEWTLDHEILKREYPKMSKRRLEAREYIQRHSDKIDVAEAITFDEWVMRNKLNISAYDYEILEGEYERMRERQREVLERESEAAGVPTLLPPDIKVPLQPPLMSLWEQRELGSIRDRLSNVRYEISALNREISNLDTRISEFSYPPRLRLAVYILPSFAFFSIVLPVSLILKEEFSYIMKQITFYFFIAGLVAVITYITLLIVELRRSNASS